MHRFRFLLLVLCVLAATDAASAQDRGLRRGPRAWLVLSDGLGVTGGGISGASGLSQLFRVSGVAALSNAHGIELSALRIQEVYPAAHRFDNPELNLPEADGLILSYASLARRGSAIPSVFSVGGGVLRRPSNDPLKDRHTWGAQLGLESDLADLPVDWADLSAGARVVVMPASNNRYLYMLAVTLGVRIGR
jgi:hypothetical protein